MNWYLLPSPITLLSYVLLYLSNKYYKTASTTLAWILIWSSALSSLAVFRPIIQLSTLVGPYLGPAFILTSLSFTWHLYFSWLSFAGKSTGTKFLENIKKDVLKILDDAFGEVIRQLWEALKGVFKEPLEYLYQFLVESWIGLTNIPKTIWNLFHSFFYAITSLGGSLDKDLIPPIPPAVQLGRTKNEILNGRFWKNRNENDIYFSLNKSKYDKDNTFVSEETYNQFRTFVGLPEDVNLKQVKTLGASGGSTLAAGWWRRQKK